MRDAAIDAMMAMIRDDLAALNITHEVFFSERSLHVKRNGLSDVDVAIADLRAKGLVYEGRLPPPKGQLPEDWEDREQTLFRSTDFGDDVDRPLKKSDGAFTYFASDIAYHRKKIEGGYDVLVDVWGADHGGYVKRMGAAVEALSRREMRARRQAVPDGQADARRRAGENVEKVRRLRHLARSGGRGRRRRRALHDALSQE